MLSLGALDPLIWAGGSYRSKVDQIFLVEEHTFSVFMSTEHHRLLIAGRSFEAFMFEVDQSLFGSLYPQMKFILKYNAPLKIRYIDEVKLLKIFIEFAPKNGYTITRKITNSRFR